MEDSIIYDVGDGIVVSGLVQIDNWVATADAMACDSEDDLTHNAYNNLDVHVNVLGIAYLPVVPSPTLHFSGSCARHRWTTLMLTTYLMK
eukprot:scaffold3946_cov95-Skeletonema_dohrnii-CCMP3373.AAC.1